MTFKKEKYWKISGEERLQIFPKDSTQIYLTCPTKFVPKDAFVTGNLKVPPPHFCDLLGRFGIKAAAIAKHKNAYYISRAKSSFYTLCFFLSNKRYRAKFEGETFAVAPKNILLIPPHNTCDSSAEYADTVWFDIKNTSFWSAVLGDSRVCRQSRYLWRIDMLAQMYAEEIYSPHPRISVLSNIANLIVDTIVREFTADNQNLPPQNFETLLDCMQKNLSKKWSLAEACRYCGIGKYKLNSLFVLRYGETFSKLILRLRLEKAAQMAANSASTISAIAREVGFADARSLSFAFKSFYGVAIRAEVRGKIFQK